MTVTMEPSLWIRLTCCLKEGGSSGLPVRRAKGSWEPITHFSLIKKKIIIMNSGQEAEFAQRRIFTLISPHFSFFSIFISISWILQKPTTMCSLVLLTLTVSGYALNPCWMGRTNHFPRHPSPLSRVNSMFSHRSQRQQATSISDRCYCV